MAQPDRLRSRSEIRTHRVISRRARWASPHRDPNLFEIIVGLTVFVTAVAGCLYVVAALGR